MTARKAKTEAEIALPYSLYRCPGCGKERLVHKVIEKGKRFSVGHGCPARKGKATRFKKVS